MSDIVTEMTQLYLSQEEYDYHQMMIFRKLKRMYGKVISNIYVTTCEMFLDCHKQDMTQIPYDQYVEKIDKLWNILEHMMITRIEKKSPDGEMMDVMVSGS